MPAPDDADAPVASADPSPASNRILTLPNIVTLIRLGCLPIYLWLLSGDANRVAAAWLLLGLGLTDWVDGYIARRYNQVSEFGKILDPVADRLLFFVGIGGILWVGTDCPNWVVALVLAREVVVSVGTIALALMGAKRIDVTWYGKAGTFLLMGAFPGYLIASANGALGTFWYTLAVLATIPGLILSYYAAFLYIPIGRRALREGRAARAAATASGSAGGATG